MLLLCNDEIIGEKMATKEQIKNIVLRTLEKYPMKVRSEFSDPVIVIGETKLDEALSIKYLLYRPKDNHFYEATFVTRKVPSHVTYESKTVYSLAKPHVQDEIDNFKDFEQNWHSRLEKGKAPNIFRSWYGLYQEDLKRFSLKVVDPSWDLIELYQKILSGGKTNLYPVCIEPNEKRKQNIALNFLLSARENGLDNSELGNLECAICCGLPPCFLDYYNRLSGTITSNPDGTLTLPDGSKTRDRHVFYTPFNSKPREFSPLEKEIFSSVVGRNCYVNCRDLKNLHYPHSSKDLIQKILPIKLAQMLKDKTKCAP